jgi:cephalosporin hydroxylase
MGFGLRNKYRAAKNEVGIRLANAFARPNKNINSVYFHPSDMCEPDRIMLYALVRGMRPERVLEIGARWGGSARIISSALEDSGFGKAIGIDPEPQAFRPTPADLFNRYTLMTGYSPEAIPGAVSKLGGKIDFAFIDAMHTHDHVLADFTGVIPHLSNGAHVLLHDTFHVGINAAIAAVLTANPSFVDCGFLTRYPYISDAPVAYQGLRLIRTGPVEGAALISESFTQAGRKPDASPALYNWDPHWNRIKPS